MLSRLTLSGMKGYKDIMTRDNCIGHGERMYIMTDYGDIIEKR
jgi:hypothetical protein